MKPIFIEQAQQVGSVDGESVKPLGGHRNRLRRSEMAGQLDHRQHEASADRCRCDDDGLRYHFAVLAQTTVLATVPHVPVECRSDANVYTVNLR